MAKKKKPEETRLELYRRLQKKAWKHLRKKYPAIRTQRGLVMARVSKMLTQAIVDGEPMPTQGDAISYVELSTMGVEEG